MNRNSQTRITNDEIRRNTEILMTNEPLHTGAPFDIRASDFFRHLSFVIRHSTTGSWSQCIRKNESGLSMSLAQTNPPRPLPGGEQHVVASSPPGRGWGHGR